MFYCNVIFMVCMIVSGIPPIYMAGNVLKEYCFWETFSANCNENEVIIMQSVLYGLMQKNRCVDENYVNYIGCSSNQLDYFDRVCSGLRSCDVIVHNKNMKDKIETMCPEPYIEASYACQKVVTVSSKCTTAKSIDIKTGFHYISSIVSRETECGYGNTPYVLNAKSGQQINLTLVDFGWGSRTISNWNQPNKCHNVYGHVLSADGNIVDICGGSKRTKHLYTSTGHQVQLVIQQDLPQNIQFLIKFQAIGCPDYIPPKNTWLRKDDNNIIVGCQSTSDTWQLRCVGSHWIGVIGNCTEALVSQKVIVSKNEGEGFSGHHVFAVGIGCVAIILCCVTIAVGIYCIKRYKITMKSKFGNDQASESYLMPNSTWTGGVNTMGQRDSTVGFTHLRGLHTANRTPTSGIPQTGSGLNREENEAVQYFVLEKPPGYVDN